jgi:predicted dienelactone hydrolase
MRTAAVVLLAAALALPATAVAADQPGPSHSYPVWRGGDASLPDHTIIRPVDLNEVEFLMPIVVWGNGGCRDSNEEYHYFLTHFAAYGYFIVANGPPENAYHPEELTGLVNPQPQKLIAGIDWAVKQDSDPASPYYGRLDTSKIVVMGQSCGGWEATDASSDPRVTTTVIWNSGTNAYHPQGVTALHAPVLYVDGGIDNDYVAWETNITYAVTSVPAVLAENSQAGHTGFWDDPSDGSPPPGPYQNEPLVVAPQWLAFMLYGSPEGRAFFFGSDCGLCSRPNWTVQSKNWGS